MHFLYECSFSSWCFALPGWVQAPSHAIASPLRAHGSQCRTHTPGSSNAASAARSLHGAPPAALLQPVNASTGKTMPYHKVAIKTGLSSDSPSENPAPPPKRGQRLLSGVCGSGVPARSRGTGESLEPTCSNTRRAESRRCWKSAAEPLSLDGCWFSSPGG